MLETKQASTGFKFQTSSLQDVHIAAPLRTHFPGILSTLGTLLLVTWLGIAFCFGPEKTNLSPMVIVATALALQCLVSLATLGPPGFRLFSWVLLGLLTIWQGYLLQQWTLCSASICWIGLVGISTMVWISARIQCRDEPLQTSDWFVATTIFSTLLMLIMRTPISLDGDLALLLLFLAGGFAGILSTDILHHDAQKQSRWWLRLTTFMILTIAAGILFPAPSHWSINDQLYYRFVTVGGVVVLEAGLILAALALVKMDSQLRHAFMQRRLQMKTPLLCIDLDRTKSIDTN